MSNKRFVPTKNVATWETITGRLDKFSPNIALADYVDFAAPKPIEVLDYASEGVHFVVAKHQRVGFLKALREAKTESGKKGFEEGRWQGAWHAIKGAARDLATSVTGRANKDSFAMNISYKATKGIGFREIWYLELSHRELRLQNARTPRYETRHAERALHLEMPELDPQFGAMFGAANPTLDLSSLHWAVEDPDPDTGRSQCNLHIDQVGIAASYADGTAVTPNVGYHTLVELAFRTGFKGILPDWLLQNLDFILPAAHENYALNFGAQLNLINKKDLRLSVRGMCSVRDGGCDWSGTVNLGIRHNVGGSK